MKHKIIFEGAELAGKSYLLSQVYNYLEPKYNSGGRILDGCHWFNCDVGLYGTPYGQTTLQKFLELMEELDEANVMLEKFHLAEAVYQQLYHGQAFNFKPLEERLQKIKAKIVLVTFQEDEELIKHRLADRLKLYPHYAKIAQAPQAYIYQQQLYKQQIKDSQLEHLIVDATKLPNDSLVDEILTFLKEK